MTKLGWWTIEEISGLSDREVSELSQQDFAIWNEVSTVRDYSSHTQNSIYNAVLVAQLERDPAEFGWQTPLAVQLASTVPAKVAVTLNDNSLHSEADFQAAIAIISRAEHQVRLAHPLVKKIIEAADASEADEVSAQAKQALFHLTRRADPTLAALLVAEARWRSPESSALIYQGAWKNNSLKVFDNALDEATKLIQQDEAFSRFDRIAAETMFETVAVREISVPIETKAIWRLELSKKPDGLRMTVPWLNLSKRADRLPTYISGAVRI